MADNDREEKNPRGADDPELVDVFASIDLVPMRVARDMLEQAGIETFVFDRESSRMLGTTPAVPTRLMVFREDAAEAHTRLKDLGLVE